MQGRFRLWDSSLPVLEETQGYVSLYYPFFPKSLLLLQDSQSFAPITLDWGPGGT